MFQKIEYSGNRTEDYKLLCKQLHALSEGETDHIAILANAAALLNQFLQDINWVGFYLWKEDELILGPFQGLPACIRIGYGKGVCGTAIKEKRTQRVADVSQFPGHIACDSASQSEIVVPLFIDDAPYGVLDIDSPIKNRFDTTDEEHLESFCNILVSYLQ
ncbi:MAG TPA: GAF domain-containing protein [Bacillota bacterium]|nr:GAF domain-containing protein [Bacillota bacterium]